MAQQNTKALSSEEMRKKLKDAFLELYETSNISKISVAQIVEKAKVSRGSFYYHYADIYDLQTDIEDDLIRGLNQAVRDKIILDKLIGNDEDAFDTAVARYIKTLTFISDNAKAFLAMYYGPSSGTFQARLHHISQQNLTVAFESVLGAAYHSYMSGYTAAGSIATYMEWLRSGQKESAYDLARFIIGNLFKLTAKDS